MMDIRIDGYPLNGISDHEFNFGFPCIHISDWKMKIMDILNSIINIRVFFRFFNYGHLFLNLSWTICIKSRIFITELWISIIQLWDIHVIELWISINNNTLSMIIRCCTTFPCLYVSDWQMKIHDHREIDLSLRTYMIELWISAVECWISIVNHGYPLSFVRAKLSWNGILNWGEKRCCFIFIQRELSETVIRSRWSRSFFNFMKCDVIYCPRVCLQVRFFKGLGGTLHGQHTTVAMHHIHDVTKPLMTLLLHYDVTWSVVA